MYFSYENGMTIVRGITVRVACGVVPLRLQQSYITIEAIGRCKYSLFGVTWPFVYTWAWRTDGTSTKTSNIQHLHFLQT